MTRLLLPLLALSACVSEKAPPPAPQAEAPIVIEVWHDTICPWCRIGLHNLDTALERWSGRPVEVVHHPFLLSPETPSEGLDFREEMLAKLGEERLQASFSRVTQMGAALGLRFDFDKIRVSPQTTPSHLLVEWAPPAKRAALLKALHRAHFEEGLNIGQPQILAQLAQEVGLSAEEALRALDDPQRQEAIRQSAAQARTSGVRGVPHFVIGERTINGAQSAQVLLDALQAASRAL